MWGLMVLIKPENTNNLRVISAFTSFEYAIFNQWE